MAKTPAGSSALFRAAFLVLTLSFILLIVGYTTPNWTEIVIGDVLGSKTGLWKTCTEVFGGKETCGESAFDDESKLRFFYQLCLKSCEIREKRLCREMFVELSCNNDNCCMNELVLNFKRTRAYFDLLSITDLA